MDDKLKLIIASFGQDRIRLNEPLKDHFLQKVTAKAKLFFIAFTILDVEKMVKAAFDLKIPLVVFGTGSKMVIADSGFEGIVLKNRTSNISIIGVKGKVSKNGIGVEEALVEVDSGVTLKKLVEFLKTQNLSSSEYQNLPGTVGGNLYLNRNLKEKLQSAKVIEKGEVVEVNKDSLNIRNQILLQAVFKFRASGS